MPVKTSSQASVIIPTYRRGEVLCRTISDLIRQNSHKHYEIIIVDQLANHPEEVCSRIQTWVKAEKVYYYNLSEAGANKARNYGAGRAVSNILIFLDDDIIIGPDLIRQHIECYRQGQVDAVAGGVRRKGEELQSVKLYKLWTANISVRSEAFWEVGGMDEAFGIHGYFDDEEFGKRLELAGKKIIYYPQAYVNHLEDTSGGHRLNDVAQKTEQWQKSFGPLYYLFLHGTRLNFEKKISLILCALRYGPFLKRNVFCIYKQPKAWAGFFLAVQKAGKKARYRKMHPLISKKIY